MSDPTVHTYSGIARIAAVQFCASGLSSDLTLPLDGKPGSGFRNRDGRYELVFRGQTVLTRTSPVDFASAVKDWVALSEDPESTMRILGISTHGFSTRMP